MKFKSKVGCLAFVLGSIPAITVIYIIVVFDIITRTVFLWIFPFIMIPISIFAIAILIKTYYTLGENVLYIRFGLHYMLRIPYKNIISVDSKTTFLTNTMAGFSLDNL